MDVLRDEGLTVFTIATNKYWDYFLELLPNLRGFISTDSNLEVIVLTNRHPQGVLETEIENLTVRVFPSEFNDWPKVTLMRYGQILKFEREIKTNKFLWLDVDMLFVKSLDPEILNKGIYLAPHPGYVFNLTGFLKLRDGNKRAFLKDKLRRTLRRQLGRGAWETNSTSTAFVPPKLKRHYVHGAVWGGKTSQVIEMCRVLSDRIEADLKNNYIAIWHDESHLNWFQSHFPQKLFSTHFSGALNHWTSNTSRSTLISLDKSELDKKLGL
jgi:hypothetical protein